LLYLKKEGLIAPDEIAAEVDAVPLDFTTLNNREISAVHSRYSVRHAHALFVTARYASQLVALQRDLKMEQAKFRHLNAEIYKAKYQADDAMILDPRIMELEDRIVGLTAKITVLEALIKGYEDLHKAASREMTRRMGETAPRD
jgi:hypothetical protein